MNQILHYTLLLLLPTVVFIHLYCSPYTKVEESFNIQAIHDILTYGIPNGDAADHVRKHYDHVAFPGSVPRTFVGALSVAGISWPFNAWFNDPHYGQMIARTVVGLFNAAALLAFQDTIRQSFGRVAGYWYLFFQCSQFHIMYYASRTLPNMYAFGITTIAFRYIIFSNFGSRAERAQRVKVSLSLLTVAGIIFRAEIALLLACETGWLLFFRRVSLRRVIIPAGLAAMTMALLTTVAIDSIFWQDFPIWPEWVAFRYNTIEGKSSDWGISPWYFYFINAIPRLMMNPVTLLLCIPVALADRLTRSFCMKLLLPLLVFVGVYSLLPHKEWRFIIYVIPGFTAVASAGAAYIWNRRTKSWLYALLSLVLVVSTIGSFATSMGLLYISSLNYPGASALQRLHEIAGNQRPFIRVHLDNLACQTGVTRFLQNKAPHMSARGWENQTIWYYDKTEDDDTTSTREFWERFDYALMEQTSKPVGQWIVLETIKGFAGVGVTKRGSPARSAKPTDRMERQLEVDKGRRLISLVMRYWRPCQRWLESHVTRGYWPELMMKPKLYIMKKQDD